MRSLRFRALAAFMLVTSLLPACGGGGGSSTPAPAPAPGPTISSFTSERPAYFVGERARLTASFTGGTARIEPGNLAIANGATVETPVLTTRTEFRLVVTDGARSASATLALGVGYRERLRTLQMPFARAEHATAELADGSVVIVGGEDGGNTLPVSVWRFDPADETFRAVANLATGRTAHTVVALPNGRVLVYGGSRALTGAPFAEIVDVNAGTARATLGQPANGLRLYSVGVPLAGGRVLFVGGFGTGGSLGSAELFDPQTEQFTRVPSSLTYPRYGHTATRLPDGRVLVYGGFGSAGVMSLPPEIYDPGTNTFAPLPNPEMSVRGNHAALRVADGSVWIVGGEDFDGLQLASVLRFDPATNTFTRLPDLLTRRNMPGAALLTDSRVFTAGGDIGGEAIASDTVELLATDGVRRAGPVLATPRVLHTVHAIAPTGKVLVLGGLGANLEVLATAELFE